MKLNEFVTNTLTNIMQGIEEATPSKYISVSKFLEKIDFDIAIYQEGDDKDIHVHTKTISTTVTTMSRLKFSVPLLKNND